MELIAAVILGSIGFFISLILFAIIWRTMVLRGGEIDTMAVYREIEKKK